RSGVSPMDCRPILAGADRSSRRAEPKGLDRPIPAIGSAGPVQVSPDPEEAPAPAGISPSGVDRLGTLVLDLLPWAEIRDIRRIPDGTPVELTRPAYTPFRVPDLPPGQYEVRYRHPQMSTDGVLVIDVLPGEAREVIQPIQELSLPPVLGKPPSGTFGPPGPAPPDLQTMELRPLRQQIQAQCAPLPKAPAPLPTRPVESSPPAEKEGPVSPPPTRPEAPALETPVFGPSARRSAPAEVLWTAFGRPISVGITTALIGSCRMPADSMNRAIRRNSSWDVAGRPAISGKAAPTAGSSLRLGSTCGGPEV
ncbi:MAG: hypothetical protein NZ742_05555, partial [Acidobacteria bacterium]|nr:hypothetical protein [Acidobacteriota bacterium]MDW7984334.1 hypothetical protein [Acidobacteriota bacterium]